MVVRSGDHVVTDADGAVVLAAGEAESVLEMADERTRKGMEFMDRLRAGETTLDLYGFRRDSDGG